MHVWRRPSEEIEAVAGIARAAVAGLNRRELIEEAVRTLLATGEIDRAGVWLQPEDSLDKRAPGLADFRGLVSAADEKVGQAEWTWLSPEAPLPAELRAGKSIEQQLDESHPQPVIGALVGMRRVLWVPVEWDQHLRGILLAGTAKRSATLPRTLLETLAAEIVLALKLEDERRLVCECRTELSVAQH